MSTTTTPCDVVIVGGGPAGYTAALYASRAGLSVTLVEGWMWGGQLQNTTEVENFPGFPDGLMGPELMTRMRDQAARFGAELVTDQVTELDLASPSGLHVVRTASAEFSARTVILATGANALELGVPGEAELSGRGVSYCATCDAAFFVDEDVVVVGGGDSAMEEALVLARQSRHVTLVHRRDVFKASRVMLDRVRATENITVLTPWQVERFVGEDERLASVELKSADGARQALAASGAFIAIGHRPNSELVADKLSLDDDGYVLTLRGSTVTAVPGVFACGDVVDSVYRQAVTAAGSGCQAALDADRYLQALGR